MALVTLGTTAANSLSALVNSGSMAAADLATLAAGIKDDQTNGQPIYPGAYSSIDMLFVPNRGILKVLPGDYVAIDPTTGWPILISALAIASGPWQHT